ncbi:hypothetical protein I7I53_04663 [Histoplasma capsulatum var. duboisii H88]|uniref:Uncharacterized protein n=1 Tax=Ajellomyces capsulatus (strain H88) TaxID=544711 RepID=A0A8A1LRA7_AJEC8|nr:hypothetical protein I7I53_04663 [Histoplasma capsulatum var. duboisii H88]
MLRESSYGSDAGLPAWRWLLSLQSDWQWCGSAAVQTKLLCKNLLLSWQKELQRRSITSTSCLIDRISSGIGASRRLLQAGGL